MGTLKKLLTAGVIGAVCLGSSACVSNSTTDHLYGERGERQGVAPATLAAMEGEVIRAIDDDIAPGAVLLVSRNGEVLEENAFGNRSVEPSVPMTEDTIFELASVSKVAGTATATMLLIEDGKLELHTKAVDIIPAFAEHGKGDVTIRDLLSHQSGLKAYDSWKKADEMRDGSSQREALIKRISSLEKSYPTGEFVEYSCLNYLTLAHINQTVAEMSQEELLRERVWEPLGMDDTTYLLTDEQAERLAPQFKGEEWPDGRRWGSVHDPLAHYYGSTPEFCPGNAGLFSTASDLHKFFQMILNEGELDGVRVFKPETVAMMTERHAELPDFRGKGKDPGSVLHRALGFGLFQGEPYDHPMMPADNILAHTGYTGTYFWMDRTTDSIIILLANAVYSQDPPKISPTRRAVTRHYVESIYGPWEKEEAQEVSQVPSR